MSCTIIPKNIVEEDNKLEGRFSLLHSNKNNLFIGRFLWKEKKNISFKVEEFHFMDLWGKTHLIISRNTKMKPSQWEIFLPNRKLLRFSQIEKFLQKKFNIKDFRSEFFIASLNEMSKKIKTYTVYKNRLIKVKTKTYLGDVIFKLMPDSQYIQNDR